MADIERELESLDKNRFESLVHQILLCKYPSAGIKKVDGAGGDEGIDSFKGMLTDGPAVWQFKHFSKLGPSQKSKILESIRTAFKCRSIKSWTLCIPIDLQTKGHEWFQNALIGPYSSRARIELLQKSDLIYEIIRNSDILHTFFPDIGISSVIKLQDRLLNASNSDTDRELLQLQVERQFRNMKSLDPRLATTFVFSEDRSLPLPRPPNSLFTIQQATSALHFTARDQPALALDPIVVSLKFRSDVKEQVERAFDVGEPLKLPAGALLSMEINSPLIQSLLPTEGTILHFEMLPPPPGAFPDAHLRFVAGRGRSAREIPYLTFRLIKNGRREMTYESRMPALKLVMRVTRDTPRLFIYFQAEFIHSDVLEIRRALDFLYEFENSGRLQIFDLDSGKVIYSQHQLNMSSVDAAFNITDYGKEMLRDMWSLADHFDQRIALPPSMSDADMDNLKILAAIVRQGRSANVALTTNLIKTDQKAETLVKLATLGPMSVQLNERPGQRLNLLGMEFETDPITFCAERATLADPDSFLEAYRRVGVGEYIPVKIECDECEFRLCTTDQSSIVFNRKGESVEFATA